MPRRRQAPNGSPARTGEKQMPRQLVSDPATAKTDLGFYKSCEPNCNRTSNVILKADGAIGVPVSFLSEDTSR